MFDYCAGVCQLEGHSSLSTEEPAEGYRCVWQSVGETGGECECVCVCMCAHVSVLYMHITCTCTYRCGSMLAHLFHMEIIYYN